MVDARAMRFETLRYQRDPANPLNGDTPTIVDLSAYLRRGPLKAPPQPSPASGSGLYLHAACYTTRQAPSPACGEGWGGGQPQAVKLMRTLTPASASRCPMGELRVG